MKELSPRMKKKREAILDAAARVFSGKGYHNARMEEIAVEAGIGKGTIYEYFSSKLQLFQAMMERSLQVYYETMESVISDAMPFAERFRHLLEGHLSFYQDNKDLSRMIFWDAEIFDEELKEWTNAQRKEKEKRLRSIIEEAIKRGELRPLDAQLVSLVISGTLGVMFGPVVLDGWDIDPHILAGQFADIIMNGIGIN
ncbi:TetR/AcrR family transcriptional regulator [Syntrophomonas palmitatica]|uniref:TetR/AcrR family transcriptional regulator n=1 Tax=Syntrophomonas palmitatica TaxID=402877 RepID=UPI0006D1F87D|nr:TetR/AcrR family transcriptional regulator [Syntrophomonas palmitatica]